MPAVENVDELKAVIKAAMVETLHEQRELLREVFAEVIEDFALVEAVRAGEATMRVGRDEVFQLLSDAQ
jgi:hypothetical protein